MTDRPTLAEIRATRTRAKLTQNAAAALIGLGSGVRWAEYENGTRAIPDTSWRLFKHLAGLEKIPFRRKR